MPNQALYQVLVLVLLALIALLILIPDWRIR